MLSSEEIINKSNKKLIDASLFNYNIPKKILLSIFEFNSAYSIISNDPFVKLVSNFEEIEQILKIDKFEIINYLYFSRKKIHNILYDDENEIQINYAEKNSTSYYFYLSLLIAENLEIVNYKYSFDFVKKVFDKEKSINNNHKYELAVMSKMLCVLINNFKGVFDFIDDDEKNEEELKKIDEENNEILANNKTIFNEINLNFDETNLNSIEEIYIQIIIHLIKLKKFEDFEYTYNIIKQLDLENIAITKYMFDKLSKIFDEKAEYINDYKITKKEDLFNEKKINFFYILLKYILKSPFYIFQISLLYKLKKFVMELLRSNQISKKEIKSNKLQYLLWVLMDSEYYFSKIPESDYNKLNEILAYYKNFLFKSKNEEIILLSNILDNNCGKYKIYLNDYDDARKMNERYSIIQYLLENTKNKGEVRTEEQLKNEVKNWKIFEDLMKSKKFNEIKPDFGDLFLKFINEKNNKEIIYKIFSEDIIKNFINHFTTYKKKDSNLAKSIMKEDIINSLKLKLCFLNSIRVPIEYGSRDPTYKLLSNYSDLKSILDMNHPQTTRFLYFNIEKVLEILYESNSKVFFEFKENQRSLSFFFYLNILLSEKFDNPRFKFKQEYIRELNNLQLKNDKLSFAKLIRAKIIIELIDISNTSKVKFKEENKKIYNENLDIINKEIYCLNKIGISWKPEDIKDKKLEEIYLEIIISLIENKKFDDYKTIIEVMEQLDFKNIGLTQEMYEEIAKVLYSNKANDYKIENEKDLFIEKKINFYMIFFKCIFKDSYKVYHLELFRNTRKAISQMLKSKGISIFYKNKFLDKIKFILKSFNLPYELMENMPKIIKTNSKSLESNGSILNYLDYNSFNNKVDRSINNSSFNISQEFSYNNESMSSSVANQIIQEIDKTKKKKKIKKEIIIDESKVEEVKEYFRIKHKTKPQNKSKSSQLNIIKDINNFLTEISKKENKEILENLQENLPDLNVGEYLNLFNLIDDDKEVEKLKEIFFNIRFQNLLSGKEADSLSLNRVIDEVFYFSEPIIDINDLEKNISENSSIQINSNSTKNFNEWINNYEPPSK